MTAGIAPPPAVHVPAQAGPRDDAPSTGMRTGAADEALRTATSAARPDLLDETPSTATPAPASTPSSSTPSSSSTWPCSCGGRTPLDQDVCASCGAGFLSDLRGGPPVLVVPGVGDVAALSSAARTGLALTAVLCFLAVFASVCLLLS